MEKEAVPNNKKKKKKKVTFMHLHVLENLHQPVSWLCLSEHELLYSWFDLVCLYKSWSDRWENYISMVRVSDVCWIL